jgi:hypothetical protein
MEQKIIALMEIKSNVDFYALERQKSIRDGRYEDAMTDHFLFYMYLDEYRKIKEKITSKEMTAVIKAIICIDYK